MFGSGSTIHHLKNVRDAFPCLHRKPSFTLYPFIFHFEDSVLTLVSCFDGEAEREIKVDTRGVVRLDVRTLQRGGGGGGEAAFAMSGSRM